MFDDIPQDRRQDYKNVFEMYDKNKDNNVNSLELANIFKALNIDVTDDEIKQMIAEVDEEGDGEINFEDFITIVNKRGKESDTEEEVLRAFKIFDKEGNGLISITDLRHIILDGGCELSEEELNDMLIDADTDMDGFVNYEEFIRLLLTK